MSLSLFELKQCRECKNTGLRLYRPLFYHTIYCYDCLINLGGIPDSDNILHNSLYYQPMLSCTIGNYFDNIGVICDCKDDYKQWETQPIRISDLYEPGGAKYLEAEIKISNLQKSR